MPSYRDFNYVEGGWAPAPVCDYYTLEGSCGVRNYPLALQEYRYPGSTPQPGFGESLPTVSYCLNNRDCAPSLYCQPGYGVGVCTQRKSPWNWRAWMEKPLRWL